MSKSRSQVERYIFGFFIRWPKDAQTSYISATNPSSIATTVLINMWWTNAGARRRTVLQDVQGRMVQQRNLCGHSLDNINDDDADDIEATTNKETTTIQEVTTMDETTTTQKDYHGLNLWR